MGFQAPVTYFTFKLVLVLKFYGKVCHLSYQNLHF